MTYQAICIGGPLNRQRKACTTRMMVVPVMSPMRISAEPVDIDKAPLFERITYRFTRLATFDDGRFIDAWLPDGTSVADAALHVFAAWESAS